MPADHSVTATEQSGLVIASYGQRGVLRDPAGRALDFVLKGRRLRAVCGDTVTWVTATRGEPVVVVAVSERRNALARPDRRGRAEVLAANIDQVLVVAAPAPAPDYFIVDRFVCAAELMDAAVALVWNKVDLRADDPELATYAAMGYPVLTTSALHGTGSTALAEHLATTPAVNILVGQSGVGKSSLINALVADTDVAVGRLSTGSDEGRHTTTAAYMHDLNDGGTLIDSPGVREFAPAVADASRIHAGFREIYTHAAECRFANCQHLREPDCGVKIAVAAGDISMRRYESYKRLRNMHAALPDTRS